MKALNVDYFNIGLRLKLIFVILVALILGGNVLLILQFQLARQQTERLTGISQEVIAVLRLQQSLLAFHQRLAEVAQSNDADRLVSEAKPLLAALLEQVQRTKNATRSLQETRVGPMFLPTLEAIEITLPSQLSAIIALSRAGDWEKVHLRLVNEMGPLETSTSAPVKSIDREVSAELARAIANMTSLQRRILVIVPATAAATFFIAAFFGWAMTRRILELRFEERLAERTRIAQELHDTLLQGLLSASMQLHVANDQLAADSPSKPLLGRVLELMAHVIEEGRNAVQGLRHSKGNLPDLEQAFLLIRQEFPMQSKIGFRVVVEGMPQQLRPLIIDEVYRIGHEALSNAFRHSHASDIEVELEYAANCLRVLIRDNGVGVDPNILVRGRDGHWGLSGMKERTERIGGKLRVLSNPGAGTEVEFSVPAPVAFESSSSSNGWRRWLTRLQPGRLRKKESKGESERPQ